MDVLVAENVSYSYDKKNNALENLSLSIKKGEYVAVLGANGSGKSTLARLFNGLLVPDSGEISAFGFSSSNKKEVFEIRKKVGVVFQNPDNQLVASIVEDDVAFGPENLGVPRKEIGERIDFALKAVGMEKYRKSSAERLSGGQKQRVAIAGVLALKPEVLILDESTAMLDPVGRKSILEIVKKLNREQGVTIIAITHFMEETVDADRVVVLKKGKIFLQGTVEEVFSEKEKLTQAGLELPRAAYIADRLINCGVPLPNGILTPERLKEELCALKRKI